jgi:hypothetical protein
MVPKYLNDAEEWQEMPNPRPDLMWNVQSQFKWLDDTGISTALNSTEVCDAIEKLFLNRGYKQENIRFEDFSDQIFVYVKYADGRWRKLVNIVYC